MTLVEAISVFLDFVSVERGLAAQSVAAYASDLAAFAAHVGRDREVTSLDADAVRGYVASGGARGLGASSVVRHISTLRGFFRFLASEGAVVVDVMARIEPPKVPHRLPRMPTVEAVQKLLCEPGTATAIGLCHSAMLALAFASALRVSELVGLHLVDVDLTRGLVSVRKAKRGSDRVVPFDDATCALLRRYVAEVRGIVDGPFFLGRGAGYTREHVWRLVKTYAARAGVSPLPSPHQLRHACATALLRGGADLFMVQTMLGHADMQSTTIYTHVDVTQLQREHRRAHPREGAARKGQGR